MAYQILKFHRDPDKDTEHVLEVSTLELAQAICSDPLTSGDGWFIGYTTQPERAWQ